MLLKRYFEGRLSIPNILLASGCLVLCLMLTLATIDLVRGKAYVSTGRGKPTIWVERGSPAYRREIWMELAIGIGLGGGLMLLGAWARILEHRDKAGSK